MSSICNLHTLCSNNTLPQNILYMCNRNGKNIMIWQMMYVISWWYDINITSNCDRVFAPVSLLVRCPCRGASGLVAVVPSSTQPVPLAAPSAKPPDEGPTPAGCGTRPAGRTVAGPARAVRWPTPPTAWPALCVATPERWTDPGGHLKTSPGPSAPAAAPVPWGHRRLSRADSKM